LSKKSKEANVNLYYMKNGQASNNKKENIDDIMKRKKAKEREKRIKQRKLLNEQNEFDLETETVIQMTNRNKIRKEEIKKKELTKKEQKRKKRNRKIKIFFKIILLVGIVVGGIVFAFTSPIFNIKEIQVLNNNQISVETIISLSELKQNENIFKFSTSSTINKIKENAYIESVKINIKIPNTVKIEVQERIPRYSINCMGKYAYINNQGYILEISEDSRALPLIQGITTSEDLIVPNNRLGTEDLTKLEDVIKIMNAAKENNLDTKVTSIDISDENEYSIYLEEEQKEIHLGDNSNLNDKMLNAASIIDKMKDAKGEIFVNGDFNNKFRPYFREKVQL